MQSRHRHFLRPVTQCRYPTCVMAVAVNSEGESSHGGQSSGNSAITTWQTATAILKQGIVQKQFYESGTNPSEWWEYVGHILRHNSHILIVSWGTWIDSILLGFWERLEDGSIYLSGIDQRSSVGCRLDNGKLNRGYWVLENPPTILNFRLRSHQGSIKWIDLRNFGYAKWTDVASESISHMHILHTMTSLIDFLRDANLGSLQATVASQSLHSFKYRFLKHSIHVSQNETQNLLGQTALYGGRNECYRIGPISGPVAQFDFNSLYPSVYGREKVPVRLQDIRTSPSNSDIATAIKGKNCIARILCDTDIPCLPKRRNGNLIFPVGRFWTVVPWPELELALELCNSVKITEIGTYDLAPALQEYAQALYPLRVQSKLRGHSTIGCFIKAMLVSLPGKFGQRNKRWQFSPNQKAPEPWHVWYGKNSQGKNGRHRSVAWYVEEEIDAGLGYEAVPEIAAWITSWGRRILWEEMERVGRKNIVYVDTDSIWKQQSNDEGISLRDKQDSSELGSMRLVDTYHSVEFKGLKHYMADGVATPAVGNIDRNYRSVAKCRSFGFAGVFWHCHRGISPSVSIGSNATDKCGEYTHGKVMPDLSVKPIELEEW